MKKEFVCEIKTVVSVSIEKPESHAELANTPEVKEDIFGRVPTLADTIKHISQEIAQAEVSFPMRPAWVEGLGVFHHTHTCWIHDNEFLGRVIVEVKSVKSEVNNAG